MFKLEVILFNTVIYLLTILPCSPPTWAHKLY